MEEKSEGIKLIPDEDGFLFEIEDHNYIIIKLHGVISPFIFIFAILIYLDFDIRALANSNYNGHVLVYTGIPWIVFESIRVFLYLKNKDYKKIKFYENYIINNKNEKLYLVDLIDLYVVKFNISSCNIYRANPLIFIFLPIFWVVLIPIFISIIVYNFFKRKLLVILPHTLIIARYDNSAIGIPLKIVTKNEKDKIKSYVKKYLNKDIDEIKKRAFLIPDLRAYNLVTKERKEEILKEKFNQ